MRGAPPLIECVFNILKKSKMNCRKICQRTLDFVSLYCLDRGGGDTSIKDKNCES